MASEFAGPGSICASNRPDGANILLAQYGAWITTARDQVLGLSKSKPRGTRFIVFTVRAVGKEWYRRRERPTTINIPVRQSQSDRSGVQSNALVGLFQEATAPVDSFPHFRSNDCAHQRSELLKHRKVTILHEPECVRLSGGN